MTTDDGPDKGPRGPQQRPPNWGIVFDLGLRLGVSILIGLGGGLLADQWLHTRPLFTLIGMVLGIGAAMVTIWNVARESMRK